MYEKTCVFVCAYLCISNGIGLANRMLGKYNLYACMNIFMLNQGFQLDFPMICNWALIFLFNFVTQSKDECEYLINLAKPHMQKSTVVDSATGKSKDSRCAYSTTSVGIFQWLCKRKLTCSFYWSPLYAYVTISKDLWDTLYMQGAHKLWYISA